MFFSGVIVKEDRWGLLIYKGGCFCRVFFYFSEQQLGGVEWRRVDNKLDMIVCSEEEEEEEEEEEKKMFFFEDRK